MEWAEKNSRGIAIAAGAIFIGTVSLTSLFPPLTMAAPWILPTLYGAITYINSIPIASASVSDRGLPTYRISPRKLLDLALLITIAFTTTALLAASLQVFNITFLCILFAIFLLKAVKIVKKKNEIEKEYSHAIKNFKKIRDKYNNEFDVILKIKKDYENDLVLTSEILDTLGHEHPEFFKPKKSQPSGRSNVEIERHFYTHSEIVSIVHSLLKTPPELPTTSISTPEYINNTSDRLEEHHQILTNASSLLFESYSQLIMRARRTIENIRQQIKTTA